ncbi:MAG: hypothetical protein ACLU3G_04335 [Christensenellales bacterium]
MGLFADIKAVGAVQKIKNGATALLTISQITGLLINLPDAEKNLSKEEFNRIYALFEEMRKCNTKMQMNIDLYLDTAVKIIKEFDKIAPYEKYSGGNEIEFSFLMADIRGKNYEEIRKLRETISKMEAALQQKDSADKENAQILAEAWSDDELKRMVSKGEFPADQVEAYRQQRSNLELLVQTAPQIHDMAVKQIADMKKQLHELEQQ